jgi:anaerobic magnesium-protoporphyrin IX monomethyl ester cyclase
MNICLISPRITLQKNDFLGSGVPYWPIELAIVASELRIIANLQVIDMFGENPGELEEFTEFYAQGMSIEKMINSVQGSPEVFLVFAISYMSHSESLKVVRACKSHNPNSKVVILENSQAVTSYSIDLLSEEFFNAGADYLVCGVSNDNWAQIIQGIETDQLSLDNVLKFGEKKKILRNTTDREKYPYPAWDLFPISNYWQLPYSHGPKNKRYLPILTSRGCPYSCDFCVVPELNNRRWRPRSPAEVVDEIEFLMRRYEVNHFQVEDLNPTVDANRWTAISQELLAREIEITYSFVSGTKSETLKLENLTQYYKSGLRYVSISPESGSPRLMNLIGKKFDYQHGVDLVQECKRIGIKTQACFLVGHPDETELDFDLTKDYLKKLLNSGLSEVAIFIVAPFAGSRLHREFRIKERSGYKYISFSPKSRSNYQELVSKRNTLIKMYAISKLVRPAELTGMVLKSIFGTSSTKIENLPKRLAYIAITVLRHKVRLR